MTHEQALAADARLMDAEDRIRGLRLACLMYFRRGANYHALGGDEPCDPHIDTAEFRERLKETAHWLETIAAKL